MYIKNINIDNFGGLIDTTYYFNSSINLVTTMYSAELTDALGLVFGNITDSCFLSVNTVIKAEVELEKTYYVEITDKKLRAFDENSFNCTNYYLYFISHHKEENDANCFSDFKRQNYPHRLLRYKNTEKYYSGNDFATITGGIGETKTFRSYLNSYIKNFRPLPLIRGKDYYLILDESGKFEVFGGGYNNIPLSETESLVYHFLCFIHLAKFWSEVEKIRDINHHLKPLIIPDFLERLDENVDKAYITALVSSCERQTIFIKNKR